MDLKCAVPLRQGDLVPHNVSVKETKNARLEIVPTNAASKLSDELMQRLLAPQHTQDNIFLPPKCLTGVRLANLSVRGNTLYEVRLRGHIYMFDDGLQHAAPSIALYVEDTVGGQWSILQLQAENANQSLGVCWRFYVPSSMPGVPPKAPLVPSTAPASTFTSLSTSPSTLISAFSTPISSAPSVPPTVTSSPLSSPLVATTTVPLHNIDLCILFDPTMPILLHQSCLVIDCHSFAFRAVQINLCCLRKQLTWHRRDASLAHSIFDRIYVLNADWEPHRWLNARARFKQMGLHVKRLGMRSDRAGWCEFLSRSSDKHAADVFTEDMWNVNTALLEAARQARTARLRSLLVLRDTAVASVELEAIIEHVVPMSDWKLMFLASKSVLTAFAVSQAAVDEWAARLEQRNQPPDAVLRWLGKEFRRHTIHVDPPAFHEAKIKDAAAEKHDDVTHHTTVCVMFFRAVQSTSDTVDVQLERRWLQVLNAQSYPHWTAVFLADSKAHAVVLDEQIARIDPHRASVHLESDWETRLHDVAPFIMLIRIDESLDEKKISASLLGQMLSPLVHDRAVRTVLASLEAKTNLKAIAMRGDQFETATLAGQTIRQLFRALETTSEDPCVARVTVSLNV